MKNHTKFICLVFFSTMLIEKSHKLFRLPATKPASVGEIGLAGPVMTHGVSWR